MRRRTRAPASRRPQASFLSAYIIRLYQSIAIIAIILLIGLMQLLLILHYSILFAFCLLILFQGWNRFLCFCLSEIARYCGFVFKINMDFL